MLSLLSRLDFLRLIGLSSALPFLERFDVGPRPERLTCLWSGPVAGFQFHQGHTVAADLQPGHLLLLAREPENRYDDQAIAVYSASTKLGYVPRADNAVLAAMLDSGEYALLGKVAEVLPNAQPWERLWFSIYHVRQAGA